MMAVNDVRRSVDFFGTSLFNSDFFSMVSVLAWGAMISDHFRRERFEFVRRIQAVHGSFFRDRITLSREQQR
jgi:hypothetical protein